MIVEIARTSAKSIWKDLGEEALKKAVSTFVGEGVKALIDVWKSKHMETWKAEFKDREKARKEDAADPGENSENGKNEESSSE